MALVEQSRITSFRFVVREDISIKPDIKHTICCLLSFSLSKIGYQLYKDALGYNFDPNLEFDLPTALKCDENALGSAFLRHLEGKTENRKAESILKRLILKEYSPQKMLLELNSQKVIDPEANLWQILNGLEEFKKSTP